MDRSMQPVVYLDTHIVCWLYEGLAQKFSQPEATAIDAGVLLVSPMVVLELQSLYEVGKILHGPDIILPTLATDIGLQVSTTTFALIAEHACSLSWTRDPFDRLIVAEVLLLPQAQFITRDRLIRQYCGQVVR
jgi:PIN domain nuclease of toxin-antitoxin system